MASSGRMTGNSVTIGGNGGNYVYIDWQLASQSISGNSSTINWQIKFHYNNADAQLDNGSAALSGTRWSNGGRVRNFGATFTTRNVTLSSGSFTIGHNSDGTRSLSVSGGVDVYQSGRSSGSQSFSLPTIPRNSQVTSPTSLTLGEPVLITTNRKSSSFTHTITLRLNNGSGTVLQTINSVGASTTWTPTEAQITQMQNAIPNSNTLTLHITQRNNQVGQDSTTTTALNLTDANPTFSDFTFKDSNTATVAITGSNQVLVKGKSTLEVTVSSANKMVALKGSTADYYAFSYDGVSENKTYSTSSIAHSFTNIDTVGARAILVTAYDSRTNNTRVAKNIEVYDYVEPNIEIQISRENNFGDNVTISTGGTFDLLPISGVNKNTLTASSLKYRSREKGTTTWSSYTTIAFTVTDNGFSGTDKFITLSNTKEWEFEFQIADKFGTVTQTAELGRGTPIMFTGRKSDGSAAIGIGKIPENGTLDVEGDIYSNGKLLLNEDSIIPSANVDFTAQPVDYGILHFAVPTSGDVNNAGTNIIDYTTATFGTNSTLTASPDFDNLIIGVDGIYTITANLRAIDAPRPQLHMIQVSADGVNWDEATIWTPHTRVTQESTARNIQPATITIPLTAGSMIRHVEDHTVGATRLGGDDGLGKYQTSISVYRVG